jgi:hypothetical protein
MTRAARLLVVVMTVASLGCSLATGPEAPPSVSRVSVMFVAPERFTDVKDSVLGSDRGTVELLGELERFLRVAGERYVPQGRSLQIRVTDVDQAGEFEPWRGPQFDRIRIMRDLYPPRIDLEFRLTDDAGTVVKQGQRELRDPLYLTRAVFRDSDRLRYDTDLLADWLRREFGGPGA